jgi:glycosyltransferase involved in cell wall biosynthesis
MRIAFYSPITEPEVSKASGISRVGALIVQALERAGHAIDIARLPRSFDGKGDRARQTHLLSECENAATNYLEAIALGREPRPDLWFSYHVYYKSPDWIGPHVARTLSIPYVIAEGSHAPKRANGPWALGHEGATKALQAADRLLAMTSFDRVCLEWIAKDRVRDLKPFIDTAPFAALGRNHEGKRPQLLAVAMMRNDRKLASYRLLAQALGKIPAPVALTIAGDGIYRADIERAFKAAPLHQLRFLGAVAHADLPALMGESDIFAWPGLGEAYGLVYLEAQAAGLPVVACADRGVPDVVVSGGTALLSAPNDAGAYARNLQTLVEDNALRLAMAKSAQRFATQERNIASAAENLRAILAELRLA